MSDQIRLLDLLDRLAANARLHLPPSALETVEHAARRMRRRRHFSGFTSLVGIAGGTGSGKSSLFNAMSETELAEPGAQRPTTSTPLVLVPDVHDSRLTNLWVELGISEVEVSEGDLGFVLIDLPDIDSLDPSHRQEVELLLLDLDVVMWVTDPEKYRDRVLHDQFLRPLRSHAGRFVFVLNQIDRLSDSELEEVRNDLVWSLRQDGFEDPEVWTVAADPPLGPPEGIEELTEAIRVAAMAQDAKTQDGSEGRARVEIARILQVIEPHIAPLDFNSRWESLLSQVSASWPQSSGELSEFVDQLRVEAHELSSVDTLTLLDDVPTAGAEAISRHLDRTIGAALRAALRPRAMSRAIAAELQLALAEGI